MARLSRHLGSLPLLAKHRINCIRTAIKRNMEVQNYAYSKQMLELLLSKAPPSKQDELRSLVDMCVQRGLSNKSIDPLEDPSQFCAATLSRLSTIGYDVCDLCGAKFSALSTPGCIICGMGSIKRSDALTGPGPVPSPFGWGLNLNNTVWVVDTNTEEDLLTFEPSMWDNGSQDAWPTRSLWDYTTAH